VIAFIIGGSTYEEARAVAEANLAGTLVCVLSLKIF
jgi:hypothetical protein